MQQTKGGKWVLVEEAGEASEGAPALLLMAVYCYYFAQPGQHINPGQFANANGNNVQTREAIGQYLSKELIITDVDWKKFGGKIGETLNNTLTNYVLSFCFLRYLY